MIFQEWLIREMSHLVLKRADQFVIDGKKIKYIDMHFENYPTEYKAFIPDWIYRFAAKMPMQQDLYLVYRNGKTTLANKNVVFRELLPPNLFDERHELPLFWWDYSEVVYSDGTVKLPKVNQ
jgi:hypothetical protein